MKIKERFEESISIAIHEKKIMNAVPFVAVLNFEITCTYM